MTVATLSAKVHNSIPEDELIGSLTRERITLLAYEAGRMSQDDLMTARCWLAYAVNADIPVNAFEQLYYAVQQAHMVKDCDLEYWFDTADTAENREQLQRGADMTIDHCVIHLSNLICTQIGVS